VYEGIEEIYGKSKEGV